MKYDGRKKKSSDPNATIEKPITLLKDPAIDGKELGKLSTDFVGAKSERKKVKVPKIKKELPLSKTETIPKCSFSLPKWQENKLRKLSVEKLKGKGLVWVPKASIQAKKDDAQADGATKANDIRTNKKQLPNWRFALIHQNYWSWHHPYSLPMSVWNSSPGMHGHPSAPYFGPWYGSLCYGGMPNYFSYR